MEWLRQRRKELDLTYDDLAARLAIEGFVITAGSISHWEKGRHKPPMDDPDFRKALAAALRVNVRTLLKMAGYEVVPIEHTTRAEQVAHLVDKLPPDQQELALRLVEQLAKSQN